MLLASIFIHNSTEVRFERNFLVIGVSWDILFFAHKHNTNIKSINSTERGRERERAKEKSAVNF